MLDRSARAQGRKPERRVGDGVESLPDWTGECVAIVASGASAKTPDLIHLKDRIHVVAINSSWELCPWADMLYACDLNWWQSHHSAHAEFKGLKVTHDALAKTLFPDLVRIEVEAQSDALLMKRFAHVGAGGNSTFQAMNLMAQCGVTGIALVGCDLVGEHWHGRHAPPCTNPMESNFIRWRKAFDMSASALAELGIDVVNCSPISTISAFPKLSIPQALQRWGL